VPETVMPIYVPPHVVWLAGRLYQFHIKALSSLARLRLLNVLPCTPRSLNPRRLDIILDLKLELFLAATSRSPTCFERPLALHWYYWPFPLPAAANPSHQPAHQMSTFHPEAAPPRPLSGRSMQPVARSCCRPTRLPARRLPRPS